MNTSEKSGYFFIPICYAIPFSFRRSFGGELARLGPTRDSRALLLGIRTLHFERLWKSVPQWMLRRTLRQKPKRTVDGDDDYDDDDDAHDYDDDDDDDDGNDDNDNDDANDDDEQSKRTNDSDNAHVDGNNDDEQFILANKRTKFDF